MSLDDQIEMCAHCKRNTSFMDMGQCVNCDRMFCLETEECIAQLKWMEPDTNRFRYEFHVCCVSCLNSGFRKSSLQSRDFEYRVEQKYGKYVNVIKK